MDNIEYLRKLRIIKKNLIHIHGIPKSIAMMNLLGTDEYLGQYGKIIRFIMSYKVNQENNQIAYSAYITYSNELEAAIAILCIDSLLIEGKIIRAFFGTTKYCNFFLNDGKCRNKDKCRFLHKLVSGKDIIIDNNDNNAFSYNEHLKLAKKIIEDSNFKDNYLYRKQKKQQKNGFPPIDFIFLNEEEKENYFTSGNIRYIKTNNTGQNNAILNNFDTPKKDLICCKDSYNDNQKEIVLGENNNNYNDNLNMNSINNNEKSEHLISKNLLEDKNDNSNSLSSMELHNICRNSINHILGAKPFYMALKNVEVKKLELEYFIKDLSNKDVDIYELLDGCLDPINNLL